jgi:hypothetical protein
MGIKLHRKAKTPVRTQRKRGSECEVDLRRSASKAKLSVDYNLVAGATLIGNPIYARWSHAGFAPSYMVTSVLLYYRGENVKRTSATKGILVFAGDALETHRRHCGQRQHNWTPQRYRL